MTIYGDTRKYPSNVNAAMRLIIVALIKIMRMNEDQLPIHVQAVGITGQSSTSYFDKGQFGIVLGKASCPEQIVSSAPLERCSPYEIRRALFE